MHVLCRRCRVNVKIKVTFRSHQRAHGLLAGIGNGVDIVIYGRAFRLLRNVRRPAVAVRFGEHHVEALPGGTGVSREIKRRPGDAAAVAYPGVNLVSGRVDTGDVAQRIVLNEQRGLHAYLLNDAMNSAACRNDGVTVDAYDVVTRHGFAPDAQRCRVVLKFVSRQQHSFVDDERVDVSA